MGPDAGNEDAAPSDWNYHRRANDAALAGHDEGAFEFDHSDETH